MFGRDIGLGEIVVLLLMAGLALLPFVGAYGWLMRLFGRHPLHPGHRPPDSLTLEMADQLRALQSQLDDIHSRLDFAERVMTEQRDQLRALGAPEPTQAVRYEPTPVQDLP